MSPRTLWRSQVLPLTCSWVVTSLAWERRRTFRPRSTFSPMSFLAPSSHLPPSLRLILPSVPASLTALTRVTPCAFLVCEKKTKAALWKVAVEMYHLAALPVVLHIGAPGLLKEHRLQYHARRKGRITTYNGRPQHYSNAWRMHDPRRATRTFPQSLTPKLLSFFVTSLG